MSSSYRVPSSDSDDSSSDFTLSSDSDSSEEEEDVQVQKKLGKGAFGKVYRVKYRDCALAMKVIDLNSVAAYDMAKKEIVVLQELNHPNIVRYYGCRKYKKGVGILMELMSSSISDILATKRRPFEEKVMRSYTIQILRGLEYMHEKGITHRDVKSANVLLDSSKTVAKLADVGISKFHVGMTRVSNAATCAGTPLYMAPEIFKGAEGGTRADIWGVGCIAYEMRMLRTPFMLELSGKTAQHYRDAVQRTGAVMSAELKLFLCEIFREFSQRPGMKEILQHPWLRE